MVIQQDKMAIQNDGKTALVIGPDHPSLPESTNLRSPEVYNMYINFCRAIGKEPALEASVSSSRRARR
jgi:hypothetical protein